MDYNSYQNSPSREEAAKEVLIEVQRVSPGDHIVLCRSVVNEIPSLGSSTGWLLFSKPAAVEAALKLIK